MLSNVYDICTVVAHVRVSHAQEHSVRIHHASRALVRTIRERIDASDNNNRKRCFNCLQKKSVHFGGWGVQ